MPYDIRCHNDKLIYANFVSMSSHQIDFSIIRPMQVQKFYDEKKNNRFYLCWEVNLWEISYKSVGARSLTLTFAALYTFAKEKGLSAPFTYFHMIRDANVPKGVIGHYRKPTFLVLPNLGQTGWNSHLVFCILCFKMKKIAKKNWYRSICLFVEVLLIPILAWFMTFYVPWHMS